MNNINVNMLAQGRQARHAQGNFGISLFQKKPTQTSDSFIRQNAIINKVIIGGGIGATLLGVLKGGKLGKASIIGGLVLGAIGTVNSFIEKKIVQNFEKVTLINCYEVYNTNTMLYNILDQHDYVFNTAGLNEKSDIFPGYIDKKKSLKEMAQSAIG